MADSVTGLPVFVLADLAVANAGANTVGEIADEDNITLTTPGTNASLSASVGLLATAVTSDGAATDIVVLVDVDGAGITLRATVSAKGMVAGEVFTITEIDSDAQDTDLVITIGAAVQVVRDRWNARAVIAVSDADGDQGDGNERSVYVQLSKNNIWRLGKAKLGGATVLTDATGVDVVVPR